MMVNVSLRNVLAYAVSYLEILTDMYASRVKHGYKKNDIYWEGRYTDLDALIHYTDETEGKLRAICDITGLNFWALFDIAKYVRRVCGRFSDYFDCWDPTEEEIDRLYHLYDDVVEYGIYKNEYFDRAVIRLEDKKFDQKKQAYLNAEYEKWLDEEAEWDRQNMFPDPFAKVQTEDDAKWDAYWSSRGL